MRMRDISADRNNEEQLTHTKTEETRSPKYARA